MPLYEYQCLTCGKKFEWLQSFNDPPLAACPDCGQEVKKLVSSPAFQFKGTGWYITDYAGKKGAGASEGGGADAKSETSEKSEKSEKAEKSEKPEKSEKSEKSGDKPAESKPSTPAAPAPKASTD